MPKSLFIYNLFLACNIEDEPLRNGSSSIIGIGPGQSLQQGDHDSTNKSFGNLNGTLDNKTQAPTASSNSHEQSINSIPLNRISNVHPRNSIYQASTTAPETGTRQYTICPCSADVCRIRFDFTVSIHTKKVYKYRSIKNMK